MICSLKHPFLAAGCENSLCDGCKRRGLALAETVATLNHFQ